MSVFTTLVGMQSMAVASPLVTLIERKVIEKSAPIYLLHTPKTSDNAIRIKDYLLSKYKELEIHLKGIGSSLKDTHAPQIVLNEVVRGHEGEKLYFNLAGAMNYQISACILTMQTQEVVYVYPESEGIRLFEITNEAQVKMSNYEPVLERDFQAYFRLQGIEAKIKAKENPTKGQDTLKILIDKSLVDKNSLIFDKKVQIGDVTFNHVINSRNELVFVLETNRDTDTEEIRKIINLANNRRDFGELLHHKIVVITSNSLFEERLKEEAGGKVEVIDLNERAFQRALRKAEKTRRYEIEHIKNDNEIDSNKSLYVALGRDVLPTLIAIYSHQPKKVVLLYTPQDETVAKYKKAMIENKNDMPCSEIVFIPTDIVGKEILSYKPQPDEQIECNITPGTKAQGAMLTVFAKMHNGTVWSIKQDEKGMITQIPDGDCYGLKEPTNIELLKLKGFIVNEYKPYSKDIEANCRRIISFLTEIKDLPVFKSFPKKNLNHENWQYTITVVKGETPYESELCKENDCIKIKVHMDEWYEDLTAWALKEAGATDIILNYIRQTASLPKHGIFSMTEIDIVSTYLGKRFVVSCKTSKSEKISKAVADLKGTTSILGRFAIPLLSYFRHRGDPELVNGVYVFGVDTLSDTQRMQKLLNDAIQLRRTTSEEVT